MKKYLNQSTAKDKVVVIIALMTIYLTFIFTTNNYLIIAQSKSLTSQLRSRAITVDNLVTQETNQLKANTDTSSVRQSFISAIATDYETIELNNNQKELITKKNKVTIDGFEFDYISGAPSSVYEDMAERKRAEEQKSSAEKTDNIISNSSAAEEQSSIVSLPSGYGVLTPSGGVNYFGGQKETYYNLPMNRVVQIAHDSGITGDYWIREDGCKMLGNYIMIASNQSVHPYGSLVETSLGTGIVVDTGEFAIDNPMQVDIATSW